LGKVDIAITQLSNMWSGMSAENKKGFNLMDQLQPKLIIPTHIHDPACAKIASDKWNGYESYKKFIGGLSLMNFFFYNWSLNINGAVFKKWKEYLKLQMHI